MVVLYTSAGCVSCRKAKQWLKQNDIDFLEKNIFSVLLDENEISYLASRCENGFDDIVSKRSKVVREAKIDLDNLSFKEMVSFIQQNPSSLKRPILIDTDKLLVGFNDEEISTFLPSEIKQRMAANCTKDCPNYPLCGKVREEIDAP